MHQFYSALQYVIAILTYAPCLPCRLFAALTLLAYSLTCFMPFKARVFFLNIVHTMNYWYICPI